MKRDAESAGSDFEEVEQTPPKKQIKSNKDESVAKNVKASSGGSTETINGEHVVHLTGMKRVTVSSFKGKKLVNIREFYTDKQDGTAKPGKKGIALSLEDWEFIKANLDYIDSALKEK